MKNKFLFFLLFLMHLVAAISPLYAQNAYLETENLRLIFYKPIHSFIALHTVRCFENSLSYHRALWDYKPSEKVTVTLYDINDFGNAGATAIPKNRVAIMIAPPSYVYETSPANERVNTFMNHELVHVLAMDKASGWDRFYRALFRGKVKETSANPLSIIYGYLTAPRVSSPRWYHEGIAVFLETWMAGALGRAMGAYDEMVFRTLVRDSCRIYDQVGLESEGTKVDFQVGVNSYLYGTRFFSHLAYHYGPESLIDWVSRTGDSKGYFASQFKKVYGLPLGKAWSQWIEWERGFQQTNLDSIRQYPTTPYRVISQKPLGSVSRAYYDSSSGTLYTAVNFPGEIAHLASIDINTGEIEKIHDVKGPALYDVTSLAYNPDSRTLFYTTDNDDWRDLRSLDIQSGKTSTLIKDVRAGDLTFNQTDSSLWGVRHYNGISTLVRIPFPYDDWNQIYSFPYGRDIYDIDISPDGAHLTAAMAKINGQQTLIMMRIDKLFEGDATCDTLYDFGKSNPANFVFSRDGRYIYGSSYSTGVSNIFRYDLVLDSMEALSNCETGFFRPLPISSDSLFLFRYTGKGFVPVMIDINPLEDVSAIKYLGQEIVERHPVVKDWIAASPGTINLDSLNIDSGAYFALTNMRINSLYPIVEGYKDYPAYGLRINLAEPSGLHVSDLSVSYTPNNLLPKDERWHARGNYRYREWSLGAKYNAADFYDLFGPTKASRKGYSVGLGYKKTLIYDGPRRMNYVLRLTGYGGLEKLPDYQNIFASYDRFATFRAQLGYSNQHASLGAVDYEKGYRWQLISNNTYVIKTLYPHLLADIDFGFPLPLYHSSTWLRTSWGYSRGERFEPFANFFFGGFGNNWVDYQSEKRYRRYYAFPGVDLNAIAGINFGKLLLEWNLPPLRFRHVGGSAMYLTWARMSVFSTALMTNIDNDRWRRTLGNAGVQVDFRMTLLSHLRMTFSIGYAVAFENHYPQTDEFMVSLKVM
jgi:hypothetical protein